MKSLLILFAFFLAFLNILPLVNGSYYNTWDCCSGTTCVDEGCSKTVSLASQCTVDQCTVGTCRPECGAACSPPQTPTCNSFGSTYLYDTCDSNCQWTENVCGSKICRGTATPCSSLTTQSPCQAQAGCSWAATGCGGTNTYQCSDDNCPSSCCRWSGPRGEVICREKTCSSFSPPCPCGCSGIYTCSGTPTSCSSFSSQPSCLAQAGCSWDSTGCTGDFICNNVVPGSAVTGGYCNSTCQFTTEVPTTTTTQSSTTTSISPTTTTTIPGKPEFVGGTFNITGYIEYLNAFWEATYPNHNQVAVNCTFYGKTAQPCVPNPYIQPPGKGSCTVPNPQYDYTKPNEMKCRVYDPADPSIYNEY